MGVNRSKLKRSPEREGLWAVAQNQGIFMKQLGYRNTEDLVRDVLRIEDISHNKDFELTISNLAKIGKVTFNRSTFDVEIEKVSGLKDLQLNVIQERAKGGGSLIPILRETVAIGEENNHPSGKTYEVETTVKPENLLPFDYLSLELIHRDSGLILDYAWKKAPLQNVVEPFLKTLNAFCSLDEFKKMLLEPENCGKEPQKIFENAVSWLLSLSGFHTINLGVKLKISKQLRKSSFEVLSAAESGCQIGTADIIAYEDNERILLVDCDIGGFDLGKIQGLNKTREHFEGLKDYEELKIVPVIFSPQARGNVGEGYPRVAIADRSVIESMLEEIAKGDRESARSKIWL